MEHRGTVQTAVPRRRRRRRRRAGRRRRRGRRLRHPDRRTSPHAGAGRGCGHGQGASCRSVLRPAAGRHHHRPAGTADVRRPRRHHHRRRGAAADARPMGGDRRPADRRKQVSDSPVRDEQPPFDTGESMDLGPHSLTITVGFGPSLFDERFGLAGPDAGRADPVRDHSRRRRDEAGALRRRPVHPGLRRRPAGGVPRHPQHGPGRPRHGGPQVVAARLRPGLGDRRRPDRRRAT